MSFRTAKAPRAQLHLETLEERLVPAWTGVPPTAVTIPSYTSVTLNAQRDASGAASITSSEVDYYSFVAPVAGTYRFSASTPSSNLDTVLGVFNASRQRIAYNDDISSTNTDSNLTVSLAAGQRYYFGITNYTGSVNGSYTWLVDGPNPTTPAPTPTPTPTPTDDAYENNDSFSQAYNLGTLTTTQTINNLQMRDGQDWFRFTMNGQGTTANQVAIQFTHTQGDLDLRLYNANGQLVGASEGTGNSEVVSLNGLAAGTYYIDVFGYNGAVNPNYSLSILPGTPAPTPTPTPTPTPGGFHIDLTLTGMTASQTLIFQQAAARWEQIIVGDLPDATYNGRVVDDVSIAASGANIDGVGGILGQAGPDSLRAGSYLPIHGTMQFDSADMASMEANGQLLEVVMHEMGHVLGIGTIWQNKGLLTGAGGSDPRFIGANATREYNALFGTTASGVPVENVMGAGSRDSHWRESLFGAELMSPVINGGRNPISRITVASLADLGYTVNMNMADAYTPPGVTQNAAAARTSGSGASLVAELMNSRDHGATGDATFGSLDQLQDRFLNQVRRMVAALDTADHDHDEPATETRTVRHAVRDAVAALVHHADADADLDGDAFRHNFLNNILHAAGNLA